MAVLPTPDTSAVLHDGKQQTGIHPDFPKEAESLIPARSAASRW